MKNILDKINRADEIQSKVELGKHEVELALINDLKTKADFSQKAYDGFLSAYKLIINESAKAIEEGTKYVNYGKELDGLLKKFQLQAKELGLNYGDNSDYKKAENILVRGSIDAVMQKVYDLRKLK